MGPPVATPRPAVRPARPADAPALADLASDTYVAAFGHSMTASDLQAHIERHLSRDAVTRMLAQDTVLVAESSSRLVGFVQFGVVSIAETPATPDDRELRRLYVHETHQGKGIGTTLLRAALEHPELRHAPRVYLDVWEHNAGARRFYERHGFEVTGRRAFAVASDAETSFDLVMVRRHGAPVSSPSPSAPFPTADRPASLRMEFRFPVPRPRVEVFAFFADPANLALVYADRPEFRLLHHDGTVAPGTATWVQTTAFGILPIVLGFEHVMCEPPTRFAERLIHGPFRRFEHLHEFDEDGDGTIVRDTIRLELPWVYGGPLITRTLARLVVRRMFELRRAGVTRCLAA